MASAPSPNSLYYGDCLDWMRQWPHESVDLIYLDPPFNSNANYNILFGKGNGVSAQMRGFTDTWKWNEAAAERVGRIEKAGATAVHKPVKAFKELIGECGMLAYLSYMGERLEVMRDLLSPTGSIYLHCDPTASHYLKTLMDSIFESGNFRNEIIWQRAVTRKGNLTRGLAADHDVILRYSKSDEFLWNTEAVTQPYDMDDLDEKTLSQYSKIDSDGRRYQLTSITAPRQNPSSNLTYEVMGVRRTWRWTQERMEREVRSGKVVQTSPGNVPRQIRYLDEQKGKTLNSVWTDIPNIHAHSKENLGYDTQKPLKLLERIIAMSSNEDELVLDPFCGCGTAIVAAHNLGRQWLGIDISATAIDIIQSQRLRPLGIAAESHGIPQDLASARKLAREKALDFEAWAVTRIDGLVPNERQTGDGGIDGRGRMLDRADTHDSDLVLAQVTGSREFRLDKFRDFLHVVERENAVAGVYITLDRGGSDTALAEARAKGEIIVGASRYPRVQVWSIADYFDGRIPHLPALADPFTGKAVQSRLG